MDIIKLITSIFKVSGSIIFILLLCIFIAAFTQIFLVCGLIFIFVMLVICVYYDLL